MRVLRKIHKDENEVQIPEEGGTEMIAPYAPNYKEWYPHYDKHGKWNYHHFKKTRRKK